jgi:hypothetical protein
MGTNRRNFFAAIGGVAAMLARFGLPAYRSYWYYRNGTELWQLRAWTWGSRVLSYFDGRIQ